MHRGAHLIVDSSRAVRDSEDIIDARRRSIRAIDEDIRRSQRAIAKTKRRLTRWPELRTGAGHGR